jgi:hypothetical protein
MAPVWTINYVLDRILFENLGAFCRF